MILVDTSVWIDHLRQGNDQLAQLLDSGEVATHPFVIGEIALGHLQPRLQILNDLNDLPRVTVAENGEVLSFIERNALFGLGIGYIDAHLLAAIRLTPSASLWTFDKRLAAAALTTGTSSLPIRR